MRLSDTRTHYPFQLALPAVDGQYTFSLSAANRPGLQQLAFIADSYPAAGSITLEWRNIGETAWRQVPNGLSKSMLSTQQFFVYGWVDSYRITISGISGGSGLIVLALPMESHGLLPNHFTDPSGRESRLQVDIGQTGFFTGHEFRTFYRLSIAAGATQVIRVIAAVDVILFGLACTLVEGEVEIIPVVGGTPGGTFSTALPSLPRNTMASVPTPVYASQVAIATGGTLTGGTELDVQLIKVANASGQTASVGSSAQDERGIAAGTYYFRVYNPGAGAAEGVINARWEERPGLPIG